MSEIQKAKPKNLPVSSEIHVQMKVLAAKQGRTLQDLAEEMATRYLQSHQSAAA